MKTFPDNESEGIHCQQTCTITHIKGSSSGRRQMTTDGNVDLCEGMKGTRNGCYVDKRKIFLYFCVSEFNT